MTHNEFTASNVTASKTKANCVWSVVVSGQQSRSFYVFSDETGNFSEAEFASEEEAKKELDTYAAHI
jgi:hypothetical protein